MLGPRHNSLGKRLFLPGKCLFLHASGTGHLYQGRFKSFPVQDDDHLLTVLRYVERNPVRAKLAKRVED